MNTMSDKTKNKKNKKAKHLQKEIVDINTNSLTDEDQFKGKKSKKKKKDKAEGGTFTEVGEKNVKVKETIEKAEQTNKETIFEDQIVFETGDHKKKSGKSKKRKKNEELVSDDLNSSNAENFKMKKKSKTKKKTTMAEESASNCRDADNGKELDNEDLNSTASTSVDQCTLDTSIPPKKKRKKDKAKTENSEVGIHVQDSSVDSVDHQTKENKKQGKKRKQFDCDLTQVSENGHERKKKNKKIKDKGKAEKQENGNLNEIPDIGFSKEEDVPDAKVKPSLKKDRNGKKRKSTNEIQEQDVDNITPVKKKKKKNETKFDECDTVSTEGSEGKRMFLSHKDPETKICENPKKMKKKKKKDNSRNDSEIIDNETEFKDRNKSEIAPPTVAWGTPVFENEDRERKFQRLLGGNRYSSKKEPSSLSFCANGEVNEKSDKFLHQRNLESADTSAASSGGQWTGTMFENIERQNKFIRLLGGAKSGTDKKKTLFSSSGAGSKKGLFGSLSSLVNPASSYGRSHALDIQSAATLDQRLEADYNQALNKRLGGLGAAGIGYVKDPAEGKKFHIDNKSTKSIQFSDDDE